MHDHFSVLAVGLRRVRGRRAVVLPLGHVEQRPPKPRHQVCQETHRAAPRPGEQPQGGVPAAPVAHRYQAPYLLGGAGRGMGCRHGGTAPLSPHTPKAVTYDEPTVM